MPLSVSKLLKASALAGLASFTTPAANASESGELILANYGSDNLPALLGQLVCPEAPGRDGMPVHFETQVADPVSPEDFVVRGAEGDTRPVLCATFFPSDDPGDRRSILLIGEFGDEFDQPVSVEVVGDLYSSDYSLSYQGAYIDVTPLEAPPAMIYAEVVPESEWELDNPGTAILWGGGTGCPSEGTRQVLRVGWGGGILAVDGTEVTKDEWARYTVALRTEPRQVKFVKPFALGDLNDGDNNHELCLAEEGTPLGVRFPGGFLVDPNLDVNETTRIRVTQPDAF